jgi:hypothetical protein
VFSTDIYGRDAAVEQALRQALPFLAGTVADAPS